MYGARVPLYRLSSIPLRVPDPESWYRRPVSPPHEGAVCATHPDSGASFLYPEAYCALRDGAYEDVVEGHARRIAAIAAPIRPLQEVPLTILYAFALEQLGRADEAASALEPTAEAQRDGRHRGIGARWPEMAAFLERHRLVPTPA